MLAAIVQGDNPSDSRGWEEDSETGQTRRKTAAQSHRPKACEATVAEPPETEIDRLSFPSGCFPPARLNTRAGPLEPAFSATRVNLIQTAA